MKKRCFKILIFNIVLAVNIHISLQCPGELEDQKAAYKSGEVQAKSMPITLDKIKQKMKDSGVFDWHDPTLNDREKKELNKLFEAVEIMITSRARQPANAQNSFSTLRIVERAVKKQLKEGQITESLAAKFNWDKIHRTSIEPVFPLFHKSSSNRLRRSHYHFNAETNMREFDTRS